VSGQALTAPELTEDEILVARDVWLSRRMFGWIVDGTHGTNRYTEHRTFEQFCAEWKRDG
jgi:hypothetical protein